MIIEFLLNNAFLASSSALLGGATIYLWSQSGGAGAIDVHTAVTTLNRDNAIVVDMRSKADFENGHIPGSKHIAEDDIEKKISAIAAKRPVVLVCANGHKSSTKTRKFISDGVKNISSLKGGMRTWLENGQPTHRKKK